MRMLRTAVMVVSVVCVGVVIYGAPIFRARYGWPAMVIVAIQLACGALALYLVGREASIQASKGEAPGAKPKLVNMLGLGVLLVALAAGMFIGRRP